MRRGGGKAFFFSSSYANSGHYALGSILFVHLFALANERVAAVWSPGFGKGRGMAFFAGGRKNATWPRLLLHAATRTTPTRAAGSNKQRQKRRQKEGAGKANTFARQGCVVLQSAPASTSRVKKKRLRTAAVHRESAAANCLSSPSCKPFARAFFFFVSPFSFFPRESCRCLAPASSPRI